MTELSVELRHAKRSNKKSLSLSRRELAFIPKEIFSIKTLEELDLSENKITAIEPNICELARLKVINLEGNLISDLPEEVMQLGQLEVLKVKGNPLGKAFTSLFNLRFGENLLDALARCFEVHYSPAKMRIGSKGKAETPSWLIETE
jgi:Leucine-rich repeat (LRR) protein